MKKVMLIIMDGWGINNNPEESAIASAKTPFVDSLYQHYANTALLTHGLYVGLPADQMGNSEVGHMNLGAGRIIYQDLALINNKIESGSLFFNETLLAAFDYAKKQHKKVHFLGLVSDGGIHSHIEHLKALIRFANDREVENSFVHAVTDGRDTDPKSGLGFLNELDQFCKSTKTKIASVCGRYYAMDRDKRWERVQKAYDLYVNGKGSAFDTAEAGIKSSYENGITDEFILPFYIKDENGNALATISQDDVVICFNFRTDRCREITTVLTQTDMPEFNMHTLPLYYVTMTVYDEKYKNVKTVFGKENVVDSLGEILSKNNCTQLRIAETEKYPHVTFFFSGGKEDVFEGEERIMIPSPKVATYDLQPEMSAYEVRDAVIKYIDENAPDFICLNFANSDMVGHTGVFAAAIRAVETVDACVRDVVTKALEKDYAILLTADHGNSDYMVNYDGSPNTAHTKNVVPLFLIDKHLHPVLQPGKLSDIAPTILKIMDIPIPKAMNGTVLF